jgi:twitching motility protein PilT
MQAQDQSILGNSQVRGMIDSVLPETQRRLFSEGAACDFAFASPAVGLGRYRANAYRQQRGAALALRPIPEKVPTLDAIAAPGILKQLADTNHGLVLVVGPTGSGKSTTLAAMTDHINQTAPKHILTIEDPVEFVYEPKQCLVTQREVGRDTPSFADALKGALREDPDVILLGEMRDLETIRLALTAAETGHLVLATLHTATAPQAIERIVDVFPGEERDLARTLLADVLRAVVAQQLLPRSDGKGRVAAHEILVGTPAVRNLIRESKTAQLFSVMQTGQQQGMQTMTQSLERLSQVGALGRG